MTSILKITDKATLKLANEKLQELMDIQSDLIWSDPL